MPIQAAEMRPESAETAKESAETAIGAAKVPPGNPRCDRRTRQPPNELKLSDRHRRSQAWSTEKSRPPVPVRWSAWLGGAGDVGCGWTQKGSQGGCDKLKQDGIAGKLASVEDTLRAAFSYEVDVATTALLPSGDGADPGWMRELRDELPRR